MKYKFYRVILNFKDKEKAQDFARENWMKRPAVIEPQYDLLVRDQKGFEKLIK